MSEKFRRGVVAVLRDDRGRVLFCERSDQPGAWQFPQGGIEPGESAEQAFHREVLEELGNARARVLVTGDRDTRYRWPQMGRDGVCGQEQRWFLGELDGEPALEKSDGCFRAFEWITVEEVLNRIVHWKKASYLEGLASLGILPE